MTQNSRCVVRAHHVLALALCLIPTSLLAQSVTMRQMVELSLKHATTTDISIANERKAAAAYRELRDAFIPQVAVGSDVGWSYGFPLSLEGAAPSLFNVVAQSPLYHRELHAVLGAAQADKATVSLNSKDQRNQTIQDTVLSYAELVKWEQRIARLEEAISDAQATQTAVQERIKEGVDTELDGTKARLSVARIRLRIAEAQGAADVLRQRLSKLSGLPANKIETDPDSIPAPPAPLSNDDAMKAVKSTPAVESAMEHARAQYLRAKAEHLSIWPSLDFAAQYAVISTTLNNYQKYFRTNTFQSNNATIGVVVRFPFLNFSQRARSAAADAEAFRAAKQAEAARNQASEETLRLQHTVTQMQDARDVAQLEYEIAQKNVGIVRTRMDAGTANLHDLDDAQSALNEHFITLQDATFELERSEVELLRSTNGLASWALGK